MTSALAKPASEVGRDRTRYDADQKTQGRARYAADEPVRNVAHAMLVQSTIAAGRIRTIETTRAQEAPGVLAVLTYRNAPRLQSPPFSFMDGITPANHIAPLQSDAISYAGENVAVVIAETFEQARAATELVAVTYDSRQPSVSLATGTERFDPPDFMGDPLQVDRGDVERALRNAEVMLEATYETPVENHNPLEPSATVALWDGDELTLYDATQGVTFSQKTIAAILGLPAGNVRVISRFVGGGFGCKGFVWPHSVLAAVAARHIGRAVKLVLTRRQMFTSCGHRSDTRQTIALGAARDGTLQAIRHDTILHTSFVGDFYEPAGLTTRFLYLCPNVAVAHHVVRLNVGTPTPMRAPGETPGTFALESAMDELAAKLALDPLALRVRNHAEKDEESGLPFSSKHLLECYRRGAERIGWERRVSEPRQRREGEQFVGLGMATATYPGYRSPASARVGLTRDGGAFVESGTQDIGTGTYTIMAQVAADELGLPFERIECRLGDSKLPRAPVSGGSQSAASVMPAIVEAARAVRARALESATRDVRSPLHGLDSHEIEIVDGRLCARSEPSRGTTYAEIVARTDAETLEASNDATPGDVAEHYHVQSFGAQFAEVRVDEDLGRMHLSRFVGIFDCGRILNRKTARSQMLGGITQGLGMALSEETIFDPHAGRIINDDLAEYHVPVNADVGAVEIDFVEEPDYAFNPLGIRGIGEIGITGVAAAIANAVYNATGTRIRRLPILPERLLRS
ncbi:MAG: xanthine dehydrogenase family protein molybdopterin-binding subunit [Candidatus Eremiobacteraeota bacterium]|nr:xanthine dehydrogenase family protein molybdopterin-binding subunit [Candidatus Eremiobacteraeota bacterium]